MAAAKVAALFSRRSARVMFACPVAYLTLASAGVLAQSPQVIVEGTQEEVPQYQVTIYLLGAKIDDVECLTPGSESIRWITVASSDTCPAQVHTSATYEMNDNEAIKLKDPVEFAKVVEKAQGSTVDILPYEPIFNCKFCCLPGQKPTRFNVFLWALRSSDKGDDRKVWAYVKAGLNIAELAGFSTAGLSGAVRVVDEILKEFPSPKEILCDNYRANGDIIGMRPTWDLCMPPAFQGLTGTEIDSAVDVTPNPFTLTEVAPPSPPSRHIAVFKLRMDKGKTGTKPVGQATLLLTSTQLTPCHIFKPKNANQTGLKVHPDGTQIKIEVPGEMPPPSGEPPPKKELKTARVIDFGKGSYLRINGVEGIGYQEVGVALCKEVPDAPMECRPVAASREEGYLVAAIPWADLGMPEVSIARYWDQPIEAPLLPEAATSYVVMTQPGVFRAADAPRVGPTVVRSFLQDTVLSFPYPAPVERIPVKVEFDKAMEPNTTQAALRFDPPAEGSYRWLSPSVLEFTPIAAWQPNTRYRVTVEPSALDLSELPLGYTVEDPEGRPYRSEFTTGGAVSPVDAAGIVRRAFGLTDDVYASARSLAPGFMTDLYVVPAGTPLEEGLLLREGEVRADGPTRVIAGDGGDTGNIRIWTVPRRLRDDLMAGAGLAGRYRVVADTDTDGIYRPGVDRVSGYDSDFTAALRGSLLRGDATGDGSVDVTDALAILQTALNLRPLDTLLLPVYDLDRDSAVTVVDALASLRLAIGLDRL